MKITTEQPIELGRPLPANIVVEESDEQQNIDPKLDLWDVEKVADVLGKSERTVWRHSSGPGDFPKPIPFLGGTRWISREVQDYINRKLSRKSK
jgi:predicted DNA-binding transcriptional regulator AlpA